MLFRDLASLMGCKKMRTTAYHLAGNVSVERNNRSIIAMLKNYVQQDSQSRDRFLPAISSSYNVSCQEEAGVLPHFLLTGRDLRLQTDLMAGKPSFVPSYNDLQDRIPLVHEMTKTRFDKRRNLMKECCDKRHRQAPRTVLEILFC